MNSYLDHSAFFRLIRYFFLVAFLLCFSQAVFSQANRGDRPVKNNRQLRDTRFKTKKGEKAQTKDVAGRRVRAKRSSGQAAVNYPTPQAAKSSRRRAKGGEKPGQPISPVMGSQPHNNQNAWKGGPFGARRLNSQSARAHQQNVYSNKGQLAHLKRVQKDPNDLGKGKGQVSPRSASRAFMASRSVNPMSRFKRQHKKGEVAFMTDPAGRQIRGKNYRTPRPPIIPSTDPYRGRKQRGDQAYSGRAGSYKSATRRTPRAWQGDIAGRSIRRKNYRSKVNTGDALYMHATPKPRFGDRQDHSAQKYAGHISATEPPEKRTGKRALPVRLPGKGTRGVGTFSGNIKSKRPDKGGGSISGRSWNNNQTPLPRKPPGEGTDRALSFTGNLKGGKPNKGGGSISGKLWNNDEKPITGKRPPSKSLGAIAFQGNIKQRKPEKGGGSVSGQLWNNDEKPLQKNPPFKGARSAYLYPGDVKLKRFNRSYAKNEHTHEDALMARKPGKNAHEAEELQTKVKQDKYVRNPSSAKTAMMVRKPTDGIRQAQELQVKVKQDHYVRNPSSAKDALLVREPGKAFAKANAFQGNIKMKKFDLFARNDLHPDAKFVKINKNNVPEERDLFTNFKLWWSQLFKKNETQPDHLKEKIKKPRYDNGEQGLWYD